MCVGRNVHIFRADLNVSTVKKKNPKTYCCYQAPNALMTTAGWLCASVCVNVYFRVCVYVYLRVCVTLLLTYFSGYKLKLLTPAVSTPVTCKATLLILFTKCENEEGMD